MNNKIIINIKEAIMIYINFTMKEYLKIDELSDKDKTYYKIKQIILY